MFASIAIVLDTDHNLPEFLTLARQTVAHTDARAKVTHGAHGYRTLNLTGPADDVSLAWDRISHRDDIAGCVAEVYGDDTGECIVAMALA